MKHKLKAALALVSIMVVLLVINMTGRRSFTNIRASISSIYEDRLMPATYLFGISDHLYQNRLLVEADEFNPALQQQLSEHDEMIAGLIGNYETTFLTHEEQRQWQLFKQELHAYNQARSDGGTPLTIGHFNSALQHLNALTRIQAGEGSALHQSSRSIIDGTNTLSEMEISLVILLGMVAVMLIHLPDKPLTGRKPEHYSLN